MLIQLCLAEDRGYAMSYGFNGLIIRGALAGDDKLILQAAEMAMGNEQWRTVGSLDASTGQLVWAREKIPSEDLLLLIPNPTETHPELLYRLMASREFQQEVESTFRHRIRGIIVKHKVKFPTNLEPS
jgi:hypothetical protein